MVQRGGDVSPPQSWSQGKRGQLVQFCGFGEGNVLVSIRGRPQSGTPGGDRSGPHPGRRERESSQGLSGNVNAKKKKKTHIYIKHSRRAGARLQSQSEDLAWHPIAGHACLRSPTVSSHL